MEFLEQLQLWSKGDVLQGKIMVVVGVVTLIAFIGIMRSNNELLRGTLIPLGLALVVLIGYGAYVIQSRPAHVNEMQIAYEQSAQSAIKAEIAKQAKDYGSCKMLTNIYPYLMIAMALLIMFVASPYYKGMALGFLVLFVMAYLIT